MPAWREVPGEPPDCFPHHTLPEDASEFAFPHIPSARRPGPNRPRRPPLAAILACVKRGRAAEGSVGAPGFWGSRDHLCLLCWCLRHGLASSVPAAAGSDVSSPSLPPEDVRGFSVIFRKG